MLLKFDTIFLSFSTERYFFFSIRLYVLRPLCPTIPNIKTNVGRNSNNHIIAFCNFHWPLLGSFIFSFFRVVIFLCRNRFPDAMLYMAAVAKTAATSKFDLYCRPLSAQRACMANTRDDPTNLMSNVCLEQCTSRVRCAYFYFRCNYRYIIPGTKGHSTSHLIRYTYVRGTCVYVMNTSHTWGPALGFSIYDVRSPLSRIFCRTARERTYIRRYYTRAIPYDCSFLGNVHTLGTIFRVCVVAHVAPYTTQWGICG